MASRERFEVMRRRTLTSLPPSRGSAIWLGKAIAEDVLLASGVAPHNLSRWS